MNATILDKLKKIQALAENNPSEHEAQAAAAKLQALLFEHNLELRDIDGHTIAGKEEPYEKIEQYIAANTLTMKWKTMLYNGVARCNFCQVVRHTGTTKLSFVGKKSNVDAVCYLTEYLIREIERIAKIESRHALTKRAQYHREFCYGAASRVIDRLRRDYDRAKQTTQASTALTVVSGRELTRATRSFFPHLTTGRTRGTSDRTGGFSAGRVAGNGINLGGTRRQVMPGARQLT